MSPPAATATTTVAPSIVAAVPVKTAVDQQQLQHLDESDHLHELSFGPNALSGIPRFVSFHEHRKHVVTHMAATFRNWARCGFTEGISGHISVLDPEFPQLMWMNPIGKHFALLNGSDMLCLRIADGQFVGGSKTRPVNRAGYYIHSEIHKARPDAHAICHAHTIAGRAWCAFGRPLEMLTQDICDLYGVIGCDSEYTGLVTASEEGRRIAAVLGPRGKAALLLNHGVVTIGATVDEAGFLFGLVDRSCEVQLKVEAAGLAKRVIPEEMARRNFEVASGRDWLYEEAQPDVQYEIVMAGRRFQRVWRS
ncbi:Putative Arad-like aldolase/epimerase [[Torrubiella] hemipterigena]|nr:Putative Arad-like aldolase/epimerase [[Torrubiella] hemipterigena]